LRALAAVAAIAVAATPHVAAATRTAQSGTATAAAEAAAWDDDDASATTPTTRTAPLFDSGKLLATAGVTSLEGAGGGGLAPWALITGYGTRDGIGANAHYTHVHLPDFTVRGAGVAVGFFDRIELSYTRLRFDTGPTGAALGLGDGFTFREDVFGAKIKLFGDAIYDQDRWWSPQVSTGLQYKRNDRGGVLAAIGAKSDEGADFYLTATKLFLDESLLATATVRATRANQFGILGFGGDRNDGYRPEFEGSVALLLNRRTAVGAEYRTKPNNLGFAREENAFDVFLAYFVGKNLSIALAYVDLGDIALQRDQRGVYLSLQAGF
jgi:hypothetical protein